MTDDEDIERIKDFLTDVCLLLDSKGPADDPEYRPATGSCVEDIRNVTSYGVHEASLVRSKFEDLAADAGLSDEYGAVLKKHFGPADEPKVEEPSGIEEASPEEEGDSE